MPAMEKVSKLVDKRKNWEARVEMMVFEISKDELGTYDKLVYAILCGHANRAGNAWPRIGTLAAEASCSERQVQRALSNLEARGLLVRIPQITEKDGQIANVYEIYGIDAYTPGDCQSPGGTTDSRGAGDQQSGPIEELKQPQDNNYSPTERAAAPPVDVDDDTPKPETQRPVDISEVPAAMRQVVKYFLHETGRPGIREEELVCLREIERRHYPSRVNQEIDTSLRRFERDGRPPGSLTFEYLHEALRHQTSKRPKQRASPPRDAKAPEHDEIAEWERLQQEEIKRRFGGD